MSSTILKKIIAHKQQEVATRRNQIPLSALYAQIQEKEKRDFISAIHNRLTCGNPAVIAEIKHASPSRGIIREPFEPVLLAETYAKNGAACLSVLTDIHFFKGSDQDLIQARAACNLPVLRKDFIVDPYQVVETKALGADCLLLIVAALTQKQLIDLHALALELDLAVLVEVHNQAELDLALMLSTPLVGINNRDLHTFTTSLNTTFELKSLVPNDKIVISESGIHTREDVAMLRAHDVHTFLVGESLLRAKDPGLQLKTVFFDC